MKTCISLLVMSTVSTLLNSACTSLMRQTMVNIGQHPQSFEKEITKTFRANYLLYLPEQYLTSQQEWPLILFLHGAGERGNDLNKVKLHGPPKLIATEKKEFPFVILSPQCPENGWWSSEWQIEVLNALLTDVVSRYRIDKRRIYVTGISMGGFGTWRLAAAYPDRFAAIAPICGGGDPRDVANIVRLPVWAFHGAKDKTVPVEKSAEMVAALKKIGGNVKFTVYPDAEHDAWTVTYENPKLYKWFLKHARQDNK